MNRSSFTPLDNPYQPMVSQSTAPADAVRSGETWSNIGATLFALPPALFGCYGVIAAKIAAAASSKPIRINCGLGPEHDAWTLILFAAPMFSLIGAIVGGVAAQLWPLPQGCSRSLDR